MTRSITRRNGASLQDVVTCIREHVTVDKAGRLLEANAERHLKSPQEMARLFRRPPEAIDRTPRFLDRCNFSLGELKRPNTRRDRVGYATPQDALVALAEEGATRRYPKASSPKVRLALDRELKMTGDLNYAPYFLTVHDIVHCATEGILCQGRGSAANSVICYCLGITEVDPRDRPPVRAVHSRRRNEPPDIDVDFEHERREEVIQHIYKKYGRDHAGLTATVTAIVAERGPEVARLSACRRTPSAARQHVWGWSAADLTDERRTAGLDPSDPTTTEVHSN